MARLGAGEKFIWDPATRALRLTSQNFSLDFDGVNDYLISNTAMGPTVTNQWSLGAWVRVPDLNSQRCVVSCGEPSTAISLEIRTDGKLASTGGGAISDTAITIDKWWFIMATYLAPSTVVKYFIGSMTDPLVETSVITGSNTTSPTVKMAVGAFWVTSASLFFKGRIDDAMFWQRALTLSEVNAFYKTGINFPYDPDLKGYFRLNDNTVLGNGPVKEEILNDSKAQSFPTSTNNFSSIIVPYQI